MNFESNENDEDIDIGYNSPGLVDLSIQDDEISWANFGHSTNGTAPKNIITKEEMLGIKDPAKEKLPWPEEVCGYCGIQHRNPSLLDLYAYCDNCGCCLREPEKLRRLYHNKGQQTKLEVIIASYGDMSDTSKVIDVTSVCKDIIARSVLSDRLAIRKATSLYELFGCDPSPGRPKQIRLRYRMLQRHGYLVLPVLEDNHLPTPLLLLCPRERLLTIMKGTYGHPRGKSASGRMSHDVTECLQGMADFNGGSYLCIDTDLILTVPFGDPCRGYRKDLRIDYDISGRRGVEVVPEVRGGRLKHSLHISTGATVAPLIVIESASYGLSATAKKEHMKILQDSLARCDLIEHRRSLGLPAKPSDLQLLRQKPSLICDLEDVVRTPELSVDITAEVQSLADSQGGLSVGLLRDSSDPNEMFGNPSPGFTKLLEMEIFCQGGDSESSTSSEEITLLGYPKNVITQKSARLTTSVRDDHLGRGVMREDLVFKSRPALPMIEIESAQYESQFDKKKGFNVTGAVQRFVRGRLLHIDASVNLDALLGDPCPGVRKQLAVHYVAKGFKGTIRVCDREERLVAKLELGYPPTPPPDMPL